MASIDDVILQSQQALNRPKFLDGGGIDITTTMFPLLFNTSVHTLERKLLTPYQKFNYSLTLTPTQQVYPLLPPGAPGLYRSTRDIIVPWQTLLGSQNVGMRIAYLPQDKARSKWQLSQFITQNVQGTGLPENYSIDYATPAKIGPASLALSASTSGGTLATGTYYYTATAIVLGVETVISPEQSVAVTGPTGSVTATIGAVLNATQYKLYRGTSAGGENVLAATGTAPSLVDTGTGTAGAPFAAGPGYFLWPAPDKAYVFVIDQLIFFSDLLASQTPAQTNWFSLTVPDLLIWEVCVLAATMLGDDAKVNRFKPLRDDAYASAVAAVAELQLGEQGAPAGMIEPG